MAPDLHTTKLIPLNGEQIQWLKGLANMRLNELTIIQENPRLISLAKSCVIRLEHGEASG